MKNLFKIKVIVVVFALLGCYTLKTLKQAHKSQIYALNLQSEGWSKSAAEHIAYCEVGMIEKDSLYYAYMND